MTLYERWTTALDQLRTQGRYRQFALPSGIDFTSNDYLGYASRPSLTLQAPTTLSRSGAASRLLRGHHGIWDEVESNLAAWHGAEAALMMTSGYTANEGLISTLMEPGDWVAGDELNHACIVDGLRLARCRRFNYRHNDLNHLEKGLKAEAERNEPGRQRFILTESVFSMDGDKTPLREIANLADRYGAYLIVDEAHSTGCYGLTGSGCIDEAGIRPQVLASMHTGGKALALPGAYIVGSRLLKEYLTNKCRHLIFTTAMPPAVGSWWVEGLARVQQDASSRGQLHENTKLFRKELAAHGVHAGGTEYVVPVIVGEDGPAVAAAMALLKQGYDVRAIRPPSVPLGTSRLRISIHADHDPATLVRLVDAVVDALHHD